ncbi:GSCFA domain-containing protein [Lacinutrix salivirga]
MNLQTKIPLKQQENNLIDYNSKLLLLGSCFSENIGDKLQYFKFQNAINPFGILFHPKAIEIVIENAIHEKVYTEKDIFFHNEQWHCFDAHSKLSNASKEILLQQLNDKVKATNQHISKASHIIITLGTAWVYKHIHNNKTVANCHKIPQKEFEKKLLSVEEIIISLQNIIHKIQEINTKASIIFTVSPVRHIKDGFIENTQSKAHLITAIHTLISKEKQTSYFLSYEIMIDELRDYRFYKEDMLHPNSVAVNYIWERFKTVWIAQDAQNTMKTINEIQKGLAHKPFNPNAENHKKFLSKLNKKQQAIELKHSHITF